MTRWILLLVGLAGLVLVFAGPTGTWVGIGLLLGLVGLVGFVLALAAARIEAGARPDSAMATPEELVQLGRRARGQAGHSGPPGTPATREERTPGSH
ncbi:hypothetical protein [Dokdonella sp.]|uniref:hypothetical protein n=1 Tax=Dokdonella sp. TaxID=2291710 RepID=UPI0031C523D5|nr:hypothetical protein [Dokdonella sp.]